MELEFEGVGGGALWLLKSWLVPPSGSFYISELYCKHIDPPPLPHPPTPPPTTLAPHKHTHTTMRNGILVPMPSLVHTGSQPLADAPAACGN